MLALAFAHFLRQVARDFAPTGLVGGLIDVLTLQFLPFELRGLIAASVGVALVAFGSYRAVRVLMDPLRAPIGTSRWSSSSTRSGSSPADRGSSRSAVGPACRSSFAASRSTPAT